MNENARHRHHKMAGLFNHLYFGIYTYLRTKTTGDTSIISDWSAVSVQFSIVSSASGDKHPTLFNLISKVEYSNLTQRKSMILIENFTLSFNELPDVVRFIYIWTCKMREIFVFIC